MKRTAVKWVFAIFAIVAAAGCTTLQTPEVLEPGERALGFGAVMLTDRWDTVPTALLFWRNGLADRLDIGIKAELPFPPSLVFDMKYQIVRRDPWLVALDLGLAASMFEGGLYYSAGGIGAVPMILAGTKRFYAGAKIPVS